MYIVIVMYILIRIVIHNCYSYSYRFHGSNVSNNRRFNINIYKRFSFSTFVSNRFI